MNEIKVIKRNGEIVGFDSSKIISAISSAMRDAGEGCDIDAALIAERVVSGLVDAKKEAIDIEVIQDLVEQELIIGLGEKRFTKTAKHFILYRAKRASERSNRVIVSDNVKKLTKESKKHFRNNLAEFVYLRTYARWIEEEQRRETWIETVDRYMDFMKENLGDKLEASEYTELREAILNQEVMPSMRLLQFAGKAARTNNVCAYNCSFIAPSKLEHFAEIMFICMSGTGVGFSVENANISKLPIIKNQIDVAVDACQIADSKEGWCDALTIGMKAWHRGFDVTFDYSLLRPLGARLVTGGGRSSGKDPLVSLLNFARDLILSRQGERLTSLNVHDIICKIAEVVVAGGVRRSACMSLSDLNDLDMRDAKKGQFYYTNPHRMMANNSAIYTQKPSSVEFMDEWIALMKSGSGERGIFNRGSLADTLPKRRIKFLTGSGDIVDSKIVGSIGTNPCGEIILRTNSFCNLTEVVAREGDTARSLNRKIRLATILGTYQATLSNFPYLSKEWEIKADEERLLGVSITGILDCAITRNPYVLKDLKDFSIEVNEEFSKRFNINPATAITCVKPSGTVSQVVDCASGIHARHSPYYIRRVRISSTDALFKLLKAQGVKFQPEVGQTLENATTYVLEFPVKAPIDSICSEELTAIDQLDNWLILRTSYAEHTVSVTISVSDNEWIGVANWVYDNWENVSGLSFLPRSNHVYQLAPYEEISMEQYAKMVDEAVYVDYSQLSAFELKDETEVKMQLACTGGQCDII